MEYRPVVSVIIPVFNTQSWIARCLNSLLLQTLKEIEIILIDDGSADYSGEICKAYEMNDPRVRCYRQQNKGVSAARNLGLELARGKYIMFCDSDDMVGRDYCRLGVQYAREYPELFIDMGVTYIDNKDKITIQNFWGGEGTHSLIEQKDFLKYRQMGFGEYAYASIYERKLIENLSLRFDEAISNGEDILFSLQYRKHKSGSVVNDVSSARYYYRKLQRNSLSTRFLGMNYFYTKQRNFHYEKYFIRSEEYEAYLKWQWPMLCLNSLYYIFDPRSPWDLEQQKEYCQQIVSSDEFKECCFAFVSEDETDPFLAALRRGSFYEAYPYMRFPRR